MRVPKLVVILQEEEAKRRVERDAALRGLERMRRRLKDLALLNETLTTRWNADRAQHQRERGTLVDERDAARAGQVAMMRARDELQHKADALSAEAQRLPTTLADGCTDFPECSCAFCVRRHEYHVELAKLRHERDSVLERDRIRDATVERLTRERDEARTALADCIKSHPATVAELDSVLDLLGDRIMDRVGDVLEAVQVLQERGR